MNKVIKLGIFPFHLMVSFNESDTVFTNKLRKRFGTNRDIPDIPIMRMDGTTEAGRCSLLITNDLVIRLPYMPVNNTGYGFLQHEIFHCVELCLNNINIPLGIDTSEVYAYFIQHITEEIYNLIDAK